jgi:hypothetical protein
MTIQPGGELETRQYWDAEYPNKVGHLYIQVKSRADGNRTKSKLDPKPR